MAKMYDIAILGATAAGYAAACRLARDGASVVLLDAPNQVVESPLCDWVGRSFFAQAALPKALTSKAGAVAFKETCYHNAGLSLVAPHRGRAVVGHLVQTPLLIKALHVAARAAGVAVRKTKSFPAIDLQEHQVSLYAATRIQARILLVAQGRPSDIISELALPMRTVPRGALTMAALDVPLSSPADAKQVGKALNVVELPERTELGMYFAVGPTLHLRVVSSSPAAGTRAAELSAMLATLQAAELLPARLSLGRARGAVWLPPAGVALELETHVAKRCLLVGTAGGFAEAVTGQTLAASVRSALLAADVARKALDSDDCQEALMHFKTVWRRSLADFIRPPNTSLQMLLPLLFANKRIIGRFTAALLEGKNI